MNQEQPKRARSRTLHKCGLYTAFLFRPVDQPEFLIIEREKATREGKGIMWKSSDNPQRFKNWVDAFDGAINDDERRALCKGALS